MELEFRDCTTFPSLSSFRNVEFEWNHKSEILKYLQHTHCRNGAISFTGVSPDVVSNFPEAIRHQPMMNVSFQLSRKAVAAKE